MTKGVSLQERGLGLGVMAKARIFQVLSLRILIYQNEAIYGDHEMASSLRFSP